MGFINEFKKALNNEPSGDRYSINDIEVSCPHCNERYFAQSSAQLNTAGLTFLNLDWANKQASVLICTNCGNVQWFISNPEKIQADNHQ